MSHLGCGGTIMLPGGAGSSQTISSPNFPKNYPSSVDCRWTILADNNSRVKITFLSFDIEAGSSCRYDSVSILDGSKKQALCGKSIPGPFESTSNNVTIQFKSDHSVQKKGFQAIISSVGKLLSFTMQLRINNNLGLRR